MCRLHIFLILISAIFIGCDEIPRTKVPTAESAIISVDTQVKSVVFAFEKGAMTTEEFNFLRSALSKAVMDLNPSQQFSLMVYEEKVDKIWDGFKTANSDNKRIAQDWLSALRSEPHVPESLLALNEAINSKATRIYFICNPACFSGCNKLQSISKELQRAKQTVDVIAFNDHDEAVENALRELAKTTGGDFRFLNISLASERQAAQ